MQQQHMLKETQLKGWNQVIKSGLRWSAEC